MKTTKNIRLTSVVISAICILNIVNASTIIGNQQAAFMLKYQSNFIPCVNTFDMEFCYPAEVTPVPSDWTLCYESDNIYIYERWLKKREGDSIRERKGNMIVNCTIDETVKYITDYENQKNWMKNVEENKLIKRINDTNWITYTVFKLPWPFSNKDIVSEYHMKEIIAGSYIQIKINSIKNLIKENNKIARINNYNATWTLTKISESKVAICFCASCDEPPVAPFFIQDPIMRKTFHKNLLNLRTILE